MSDGLVRIWIEAEWSASVVELSLTEEEVNVVRRIQRAIEGQYGKDAEPTIVIEEPQG